MRIHQTDTGFLRLRTFSQLSVLALIQLICASCYLWQSGFGISITPDGNTLLTIKSAIESDPLGLLSDWNDDGTDPCSWKGVGCDHSARVVSLNITASASCCKNSSTDFFCASFASCSVRSPGIFRSSDRCFNDFSCQASGKSRAPGNFQGGTATLPPESAFTYNSTARCTLAGILSPAIGNLSQLRILSLRFQSFYGAIPEEIAALKFLEVLDLRGNGFRGSIPAAFGHLSRLTTLNLAFNSLEGVVPAELSGCRKLQVFNLAGNRLSGNIPVFLGSFALLRVLRLSYNNLVGKIPSEVASSCDNLEYFHVNGNFLSGNIPEGFGKCSRLQSFVVSSNFLSGSIPTDFGLLHMLRSLDVSRNSLDGEIPPQLGNCTQLSLLVLTDYLNMQCCRRYSAHEKNDASDFYEKFEHNYFSTLPSAVLNLPRLQILWAPRAGSIGVLQSDWSSCPSLEVLNLAGNSIMGNFPAGLANCSRLMYLDLSANRLEGSIPPKLPISCMVVFNVSQNVLSGRLPGLSDSSCPSNGLFNSFPVRNPAAIWSDDTDFVMDGFYLYLSSLYCGSVLSSLPVWCVAQGMPVVHDLRENNISGTLPGLLVGTRLANKVSSYGLFASGNQLTGNIPSGLFESCRNFQTLCIDLSKNKFSGAIPAEALVKCSLLKGFEAASNQLTGRIPYGLGRLHRIVYLDLNANELSGELPSHIGQLQELRYLLLANNSLTGISPDDFGRLTSLVLLDLSGNNLTGGIPGCLANFNQLKELSLDNNCLSGIIPMNLTKGNHLAVLNVAFNAGTTPELGNFSLYATMRVMANESSNSFVASVPKSSPLQWEVSMPNEEQLVVRRRHHLPSSIVIAVITSSCAIAGVLIILIVLFHYTRQRVPVQPVYRSGRKELVTFRNIGVPLTYNSVVAATGNFSLNNLIGNGGFGATYKAEIIPGFLVAVKKLSIGRFQGTRQFEAEIGTLGRIRHPNLVTLVGYHASESQMFLIYNYLPGGNLENLIHGGSGKVSWRVRHKIALDVGRALAYLHDECTPKVLHRDIKPSNVLLDNNLNAFLSDFGLARLLGASETHATTDVEGTFGYVAPEYAMTCRLSHKADVYSYGVVLLELLSGKRALDPSFSDCGNGVDIVNWACKLFETGRYTEVFAPGLWEQGLHSELFCVLKLAIKCTVASLSVRPTMKQVVDALILMQ